jgi:hypothetical protein
MIFNCAVLPAKSELDGGILTVSAGPNVGLTLSTQQVLYNP